MNSFKIFVKKNPLNVSVMPNAITIIAMVTTEHMVELVAVDNPKLIAVDNPIIAIKIIFIGIAIRAVSKPPNAINTPNSIYFFTFFIIFHLTKNKIPFINNYEIIKGNILFLYLVFQYSR